MPFAGNERTPAVHFLSRADNDSPRTTTTAARNFPARTSRLFVSGVGSTRSLGFPRSLAAAKLRARYSLAHHNVTRSIVSYRRIYQRAIRLATPFVEARIFLATRSRVAGDARVLFPFCERPYCLPERRENRK